MKSIDNLEIRDIILKVFDAYHIPFGDIGIWYDNKVIKFTYTDGNVSINSGLGIETMPISCCSKIFCTLALTLANLDFDKPIYYYYPKFNLQCDYISKNMTLRDLLTHRSGLRPNTLFIYTANNYEKILHSLSDLVFDNFRNKYCYTNLGYIIIGALFEKVVGESIEQVIQKDVFSLLQMDNSLFYTDNADENYHIITKRPYVLDAAKKLKCIADFNFPIMNVASGILSNVNDMLKAAQYLAGCYKKRKYINIFLPSIITDRRKLYKGISEQKYTCGLYNETYYGLDYFYHVGYIPGYSSILSIIPEINLGIVALTNLDQSNSTRALSNLIIDYILEREDDKNWINRLLIEENYSKQFFYSKEKYLRNNNMYNNNVDKIRFSGNALKGVLDYNKKIIFINDHKFRIVQCAVNKWQCYLPMLHDYLIITDEDNYITLNGFSRIDEVKICKCKF